MRKIVIMKDGWFWVSQVAVATLLFRFERTLVAAMHAYGMQL